MLILVVHVRSGYVWFGHVKSGQVVSG